MTDQALPLGEGWDLPADQWIAWPRTPGLDSYERFHREAFLPLIPRPGRLTVDVGCGEGRVSRDLTVSFHSEHRPLQACTEALADAGFVIQRLREPTDPDPAKPWRRVPMFLNVLAALQQPVRR
jgi:hypothetical protein